MLATYHSDRGDKSALLLVQSNKFSYEKTPVYVPRTAVEGLEYGEQVEIPDNCQIVEWVDFETGEVRTTEDGQSLHVLK